MKNFKNKIQIGIIGPGNHFENKIYPVLKNLKKCKSPVVAYRLSYIWRGGHVAEWLRRGLQILVSQFDSGRGLQKKILSCDKKKVSLINIIFLGSSVGRAVDC